MGKMEVAVQEQFAAGKAMEASTSARTQACAVQSGVNGAAGTSQAAIEPPFARVNTVVSNSPADQAGLQAGDRITKFGYVNWMNHERLSKVAQEVQQNENVSMMEK